MRRYERLLILIVAATLTASAALASRGFSVIAWLICLLTGKEALSAPFHRLLTTSQLTVSLAALIGIILLPFTERVMPRLPRLPFLVAAGLIVAFAIAGAGWVQYGLFDNLPRVTDATSHMLQAKIFANGSWAAPRPPCHDFFFQHNVIMNPNGTWHTKYFPGQALWLSLGVLLGDPGLMMPLGWGLAVSALIAIIRKIQRDNMTALCTGAAMAVSPLGLLLAGSYMSHTTFLMFALITSALFAESFSTQKQSLVMSCWFGAGLSWGFACLTRPQDIVAFIAPAAVMAWTLLTKRGFACGTRFLCFLAGLAPAIAFLALWNLVHYGSILRGGYNFGTTISLSPLIRDSFGLSETHTLREASLFTGRTLWRLGAALFGSPMALPLLAIPLFTKQDRHRAAIAWLSILAVVLLYALFPYEGFEFEARYYAPALPFFAYLAARGLLWMASHPFPIFRKFSFVIVFASLVHAAVFYWPIYVKSKYGGDYEEVSRVLDNTSRAAGLNDAIVLVPSDPPHAFRYSSGFVFNDPWLTNRVIYARLIGDDFICLATSFPRRTLYRFIPIDNWRSGRVDVIHATQSPSR
jgi:hypothetical protein